MTLRHRIHFYEQLAALARAGVPLRASLQRMEKKIPGPEVGALARGIEQGETVGESFTAAGFSPFECHLVAAGERSAQLETVFERLAQFWMRELHLFQGLMRQLYYPAALLNLAVIVGSLFKLSQGAAAVVTTMVLNLAILYAIGFAIYVLVRISWRSAAAQRFWLLLPLIGGALKSACAYRWITALRLEFVAGVPIPDAVADAWRASGYAGAESHADEGESGLRSGKDLSRLVAGWRELPREWVDFVETGEISGEYEAMFTNMENEAARAWKLAQERLADWLPKIFSFVLMLVIGFMIIRMYATLVDAPFAEADKLLNGH